jgi:signal transduction histidine kinase
VLKSFDQAVAFLGRLNRLLLGLGLLAVLAGSALVFVVSRTFTRPLDSLVAGVRALAAGDYDHPLHVHGNDEVAELTAAFTRMRDSLQQSQRELLEAERLATIGRMASSISHDLRHHLAAIVANAEFLSDVRRSGPERQELYQELRAGVNQMTDLIDSLLEFTRSRESLRRSWVHIEEVLERAIQTVRAYPEFQDVHIDVVHPPSLGEGWFDASKLQRVFQNLLLNACESVGARCGRVEVTLTQTPRELEVRVADNGRGVPESVRGRIFEPFVSAGKENGTGLGLTVVQKIVQDHGGEVKMIATSSAGTVFTVRLPRLRPPQDVAAEADAARTIVHGAD